VEKWKKVSIVATGIVILASLKELVGLADHGHGHEDDKPKPDYMQVSACAWLMLACWGLLSRHVLQRLITHPSVRIFQSIQPDPHQALPVGVLPLLPLRHGVLREVQGSLVR